MAADLTPISCDQMSGDKAGWFWSSKFKQEVVVVVVWVPVQTEYTTGLPGWPAYLSWLTRHAGRGAARHLMFMMLWTLVTTGLEQDQLPPLRRGLLLLSHLHHPPTQTLGHTHVNNLLNTHISTVSSTQIHTHVNNLFNAEPHTCKQSPQHRATRMSTIFSTQIIWILSFALTSSTCQHII